MNVDNWAVLVKYGDKDYSKYVGRNKNVYWSKTTNAELFWIFKKNEAEMYSFSDEVWTYKVVKDQAQIDELRNSLVQNPKDISELNKLNFDYVINDFNNKFEKKDGKCSYSVAM